MAEFLENIDEELLKVEAYRERNKVKLALNACLEGIVSKKAQIDDFFETEKLGRAERLAKLLVCKETETAVAGKMIVPEYSQKGAARQSIYVFVGTHWELSQMQVYYDFVKAACRKLGLSDVYVEDPDFMNKVFEYVAFRVSQHRCSYTPLGEVWINLQNCTLEIHTNGEVTQREHRAEDFFLYCLPYAYDPDATCYLWRAFLDMVMPDEDMQKLLGEYIGYCFTKDLKLEKMAVFYGTGSNGKSVTLDIVEKLMGRSNVSNVTLSDVTMDAEKRSLIEHKLVNIAHESGKKLDAAALKQLISGEPTDVRVLYKGTHTMYDIPKFFTSFNKLPPTENTYGYMRRWLLFPFNVTIPEGQQDHGLTGKLACELPGILNWVLDHLKDLMERINKHNGQGFSECKTCNEALEEYTRNSNSALMFLAEMCDKSDNMTTSQKDLYKEYQSFCREEGITNVFIRKNFKKILLDNGVKESKYNMISYFDVVLKQSA